VIITGKGGHGANPHQTVDPIFAASQVVSALQGIVSRNVPPLESAVVSVGSIQGGSAFNIIPPHVTLLGTIRTFKKEVRQLVLARFKETVNGVAEALDCAAKIELASVTPAVNNDLDLVSTVTAVAEELFPQAQIVKDLVTMGSEDFAFFVEETPGCFVFVGSANPQKGLDAKHHHPRFDIDEQAMENAVALAASTAAKLLA
jgi:amidohydrolase